MFHMITFTRPLPGWRLEDFLQHYRTTHFQLAVQMPLLVGYEQFQILHGADGWGTGEAFDGFHSFSVYTFASRDDAVASFASPEGQATVADANLFMHGPTVQEAGVTPLQRFSSTDSTGLRSLQ